MERAWLENEVDRKRREGILISIIVHPSPATDPRYSGGTSQYVKLMTPDGQHIGTVHEVVMSDGTVPHSHPKDYTRRDCVRMRIPAEAAEKPT